MNKYFKGSFSKTKIIESWIGFNSSIYRFPEFEIDIAIQFIVKYKDVVRITTQNSMEEPLLTVGKQSQILKEQLNPF